MNEALEAPIIAEVALFVIFNSKLDVNNFPEVNVKFPVTITLRSITTELGLLIVKFRTIPGKLLPKVCTLAPEKIKSVTIPVVAIPESLKLEPILLVS